MPRGSRSGSAAVDREEYRSRDELGLGHDLVDPQGENADRIPEIRAVLAELMELPELPTATHGDGHERAQRESAADVQQVGVRQQADHRACDRALTFSD